MAAPRRSTHYLVSLAVLVMAMLAAPPASYACSPALPDPWFTERIAAEPMDLPPGVDVRVVRITRYGIARDYIRITNSSPTTLYVIGTPWTGNTTFDQVPLALPPGVGPTHKIVSRQVLAWRPIFDTPQSRGRMGWTQETGEQSDAVLLAIYDNALQSGEAKVIELAPRNHSGDDRPATAPLPDPQRAELPLIYGAQLLSVPISVSYTLNPTYEPDSVARSLSACEPSLSPVVGLVTGAALLIGSASLGLLKARRSARSGNEGAGP